MDKQEPNSEPVRAEIILSPAMQSQTVVDRTTIEDLVKRQVAEMLTKSETAIFEPFFRNRQVVYALRRLQSIPEQRVHAVRYEQGGCMVCKRSDTGHGGLRESAHDDLRTWNVHPLLFPRVPASDAHPSKADRSIR
jgi:hypothetical protein